MQSSEKNTFNPIANQPNMPKNGLRPIYIDASNVAREHGILKKAFSCMAIKIVIDYFVNRGHEKVEAYIPRFRRGNSDHRCPSINPELLDDLYEKGYLKYTPNQCYDDVFIIKAALHHDGIIVSNDQYRDVMKNNPDFGPKIPERLLPFVFSDDLFIPADDPRGRNGPKLDQFLSFSKIKANIPVTNQNTNNHSRKNENISKNQGFTSSKTTNKSINSNSNVFGILDPDHSLANRPLYVRNVAQTTELYNRLIEMFPQADKAIDTVLNKNPSNSNFEFFVNELLDSVWRS